MGTSPLSFIVLVTFLFADHKCFKLLLLLHMLVQASIKCLLKWFTDDKNDFHLSLDNIFYFILSAFLTDSKELCVFYGCVIIISLTFETFLLSIWMHWKAKCVHTDVAGHCFQTERRNSVCKEVKSLSFCLLFLFSHSSILLSVCLLSLFLFVHLSILCLSAHLSLSSYLSKTERRTDSYSDTGLCSCPQEGLTWWSSWKPRADCCSHSEYKTAHIKYTDALKDTHTKSFHQEHKNIGQTWVIYC